MTEKELFKEILYQHRKKMTPKQRNKKVKVNGVWLYPHAIEKAYGKDITKMQKIVLDPLIKGISKNLKGWIKQYNKDGLNLDNNHTYAKYVNTGEWYTSTLELIETKQVINNDLNLDTFGEELTVLINQAQKRADKLYGTNAKKVRALITSYGEDVSEWNDKQKQKFMKQILGVEFVTTEDWEDEVIDAWVETNFELIKSLSSEGIKTVNTLVSEGVQFGKTANSIMGDLLKKYDTLTQSRARLIARDQVGKLNGLLTQRRMTDAGIDKYNWNTANDERVRDSHDPLDGKLCRWDNSNVYSKNNGKTWIQRLTGWFRGIPGQDIQCFLGETKITSPVPAQKLYRRLYTGEATIFTLNDGSTFTCTLNHPILTGSGTMVPAHMLNVGQDIVSITPNSGFPLLEGNQKNTIPTFKELFDLSTIIATKSITRTIGSDFHGDGIVDEKVDIVSLEDELPINLKTIMNKEVIEKFLTKANMELSFVLTDSRIVSMFHSLGFAPCSFISFLSKLLTLRNSILTESSEISLRAISKLNIIFKESINNNIPGNIILFGQEENTLTSKILLDNLLYRNLFSIYSNYFMMDNSISHTSEFLRQIISSDVKGLTKINQICTTNIPTMHITEKRISKLSVHVYNLQNSNSWYTITENRIIVNNCRCGALPNFDDIIEEVDEEINNA